MAPGAGEVRTKLVAERTPTPATPRGKLSQATLLPFTGTWYDSQAYRHLASITGVPAELHSGEFCFPRFVFPICVCMLSKRRALGIYGI